tara:strand:+ start:960 stop:1421 length:462 start_codon:yes stop_codon:yes gene_type:complete
MKKSFTILLLLVFFVWSCSEEATKLPKEGIQELSETGMTIVNGVERSELALLMRKMYDEMKLVKDSINQGYEVKTDFYEEFKHIQTAHATEPEKIDDTYQAMAGAFLDNYSLFEQTADNQTEAFNIMLQNCLVCHEQKCPGPVKAINKLKIKP